MLANAVNALRTFANGSLRLLPIPTYAGTHSVASRAFTPQADGVGADGVDVAAAATRHRTACRASTARPARRAHPAIRFECPSTTAPTRDRPHRPPRATTENRTPHENADARAPAKHADLHDAQAVPANRRSHATA